MEVRFGPLGVEHPPASCQEKIKEFFERTRGHDGGRKYLFIFSDFLLPTF